MPRRILPFRIPFFRIFYSTTYTTIYIICLGLLAITPVSMIWQAIQNTTYQYIIMIGGTYLLTASIAIFIYSSRLYTNRSVLASVGKPYIPVEKGEVGRSVRKMIVRQLERSAIIAWESRPRDVLGEILRAEERGFLPAETNSVGRNDYLVGREIVVDPANPPWGVVKHAGWSSPSPETGNATPNLQFATVIAELPNLVEARAVSLAPEDAELTKRAGQPMADAVVVEVLRRAPTMGLRDYLTQLSYLGLVSPLDVGQKFLLQYERARFGGLPVAEDDFQDLMASFAELLAGMVELRPEIVEEIRKQAEDDGNVPDVDENGQMFVSPPLTPMSSVNSPVTAYTTLSRTATPYLNQTVDSQESLGSVLRQPQDSGAPVADAASLVSFSTDAGSVIRHSTGYEDG